MASDAAYRILRDLGAKLDPDLVREFEPVTQLQALPAMAAASESMIPKSLPGA